MDPIAEIPASTDQPEAPAADSAGPITNVTIDSATTGDVKVIGEQKTLTDSVEQNLTVAGSTVHEPMHVVGKMETHYHNKSKDPEPSRDDIEPTTLQKVAAVFVPPAGFDRRQADDTHRLLLIHGGPSTGRFTCAVKLGLDLPRRHNGPFELFRPAPQPNLTLGNLIAQINPREGGVYIIRDVFATSDLKPEAFRFQDQIRKTLAATKAWVILTATTGAEVEDARQRLPALLSTGVNIELTLKQHIVWYRDALSRLTHDFADLLLQQAPRLVGILDRPSAVDLFCARISEDDRLLQVSREDPEHLQEQVIRCAHEVVEGNQYGAERWFNGLTRNAQLYALLVALFHGLPRRMLEDFYTEIVISLRKEGLAYRDVREQGFDDLYRLLHVRADQMKFADPAYERQVESQIRNYAHLLLSVMQKVKDTIEELSSPAFWELRQRLGHAIGHFGVGQFDRFDRLADGLAEHANGGVATVAAHAICELSSRTDRHDIAIQDLLGRWIGRRDPNRMWTAAVAIGRLYPQWAEHRASSTVHLRKLLTVLAADHDLFHGSLEHQWRQQKENVQQNREELAGYNREAITRSIVQHLFVREPDETVKLLQDWLRVDNLEETATDTSGRSRQKHNKQALGEIAGLELFLATRGVEDDSAPLRLPHHEKLLDLLPDLLDADQEFVIQPILEVLARWLRHDGWRQRVRRGLLRAVHRVAAGQRRQLRRGLLQTWLNNRNSTIKGLTVAVRRMARQDAELVLVRERILDGVVCDYPGGEIGVLVVDTSRKGRNSQSAAQLILHCYEGLRAQTDLRIGWLGATRLITASGELTLDALRVGHAHPALLAPVLEQIDPSSTHFVLVPFWDTLLDGEDVLPGGPNSLPDRDGAVLAEVWQDRALLFPLGGALAEYEDVPDWNKENGRGLPVMLRYLLAASTVEQVQANLRASRQNQSNCDALFRLVIEPAVEHTLARRLIQRSARQWAALLAPTVGLSEDSSGEILTGWLHAEAPNLDSADPPESGAIDRSRQLVCTLHWLAARELWRAVDVVLDWLSGEATRSFGLACARSLLLVQLQARLWTADGDNGVLPFSPCATVFRLAESLARWEPRPYAALSVLLRIARHTSEQPDWANKQQPPLTRLANAIRAGAADPSLRDFIQKELSTWSLPDRGADGKETPAPQDRVVLANWLSGHLQPLPPQPDPTREHGIIIVDQMDPSGGLDPTARIVLRRLEELELSWFQSIVYRVGRRQPIAVSGDTLTPHEGAPRAPVIGPVVEQCIPARTRFVLLLLSAPPLDLVETADLAPANLKGFVYFSPHRSVPRDLDWEVINGYPTADAAAGEILRRLLPLLSERS